MKVRTYAQLGKDVAVDVRNSLAGAPEEVRAAHAAAIERATELLHNVSGDVYIVLDGSWPWGIVLDELDEHEGLDVLMQAARSYEVQEAIAAKLKELLAANGHEVDEEA